MAVVVQRMVDPLCSGVMFTRSPVTGDRSVIAIEGSWGLGSCIVSGEVTPDLFVVNKVSGDIIKRVVSVKLVQHVPVSDGVETREVDAERQTAPCLNDALIAALAGVALAVERHYGCPQDIEWAIEPDTSGTPQIHLLQSRPETTWAQRDEQPVAVPKAKPFDHVLAALSGGVQPPDTPAGGSRGPTGDRT
jgi:pyruvate,water dikinase